MHFISDQISSVVVPVMLLFIFGCVYLIVAADEGFLERSKGCFFFFNTTVYLCTSVCINSVNEKEQVLV